MWLNSTACVERDDAPLGEMLVLDANILIRAALGRRARTLIASYKGYGPAFFAPDAAFREAGRYLPGLATKHSRLDINVQSSLIYLQQTVELVPLEFYVDFEEHARERLRGRDEDDWPVLATALAFGAAIWSEDQDFFGTGVAVWTTSRVEIYLKKQVLPEE